MTYKFSFQAAIVFLFLTKVTAIAMICVITLNIERAVNF